MNKNHLDFNTLNYVKNYFSLFSDGSCFTLGYKKLCQLIDDMEANSKEILFHQERVCIVMFSYGDMDGWVANIHKIYDNLDAAIQERDKLNNKRDSLLKDAPNKEDDFSNHMDYIHKLEEETGEYIRMYFENFNAYVEVHTVYTDNKSKNIKGICVCKEGKQGRILDGEGEQICDSCGGY